MGPVGVTVRTRGERDLYRNSRSGDGKVKPPLNHEQHETESDSRCDAVVQQVASDESFTVCKNVCLADDPQLRVTT